MAQRAAGAGRAGKAPAFAKAAARKAASHQAAAKKTASKKIAAKPAAARQAASKPVASKPATPKRTVATTAPAKKTPAKRTSSAATQAASERVASEPVAAFAREPRIDAYIDRAAPFAQPILRDLRERVHAACLQVQETIKWGMPNFVYRGKILCGMAAFKQHASFGFWQGANIVGAEQSAGSDAMGQFGRLSALADLPGRRDFAAMVKRAMALIETGAKRPPTKTSQPKPPPRPPADLAAALAANVAARETFDGFAPSQQREYVEWVETAKREQTRRARVAQAVEWMAQGKVRNWKYIAK